MIGAGVCLAVPIAVIVLWNRLNALEAQVRQLSLGEPRPRSTPPPAVVPDQIVVIRGTVKTVETLPKLPPATATAN